MNQVLKLIKRKFTDFEIFLSRIMRQLKNKGLADKLTGFTDFRSFYLFYKDIIGIYFPGKLFQFLQISLQLKSQYHFFPTDIFNKWF